MENWIGFDGGDAADDVARFKWKIGLVSTAATLRMTLVLYIGSFGNGGAGSCVTFQIEQCAHGSKYRGGLRSWTLMAAFRYSQ
jgi:hypothetical protein